jgi:hypothetical protein
MCTSLASPTVAGRDQRRARRADSDAMRAVTTRPGSSQR